MPVLTLGALICLGSCTRISYNHCPAYPLAGERVAKELEKASFEEYPNTWEWVARLHKLKDELELCQND